MSCARTLRLLVWPFAVELPFAMAVPFGFAHVLGMPHEEYRYAFLVFVPLYLVKTAALALLLRHLFDPVLRWAALENGKFHAPDQLVRRACDAAYRTPAVFANVWAVSWFVQFFLAAALLQWIRDGRLSLGPLPEATAGMVGVTCYMASLTLGYILLSALIAKERGRLSLSARERGVPLPPARVPLRLQLVVLGAAMGVAPTSWMACLNYSSEVQATLGAVEAHSREAALRLLDVARGGSPVAGVPLGRRLPEPHGAVDEMPFVAGSDGTIVAGRGAQRFLGRSRALSTWFDSAARNEPAGTHRDPSHVAALTFERIDRGTVVGIIARAPRAVTRDKLRMLAFFSFVPVLWAGCCAVFLIRGVATPMRAFVAAVADINRKSAASTRRVPIFSSDEFGLLAQLVNAMVDSQEALARAMERVRGERERLRSVLEAMPVGVMVIDQLPEREVFWNGRLEEIFQVSFREGLRDRVSSSRPTRLDGRAYAFEELPLVRALGGGEHVHGEEFAIVRRDGHRAVLRASAGPIHDASGRIVAGVMTVDDITEEKLAEEERERVARFRELFVGILGHDLRSPLGAVRLGAAHLLRTLGGPELRLAQRVSHSAERMARMIDQMLDLTRSRLGGGIPVRPVPADLHEICRRVVEEVELAHPEADLRCVHEGDPHGEWDPDRLAQAIANLVGNAVEHGNSGTPVTVSARGSRDRVEVAVHNFGAAIPRDQIPILFDPFRQATERRRARGGLGLGLYIANQIVLAHGGSIAVESDSREGNTFRILLPRRAVASSTG